ncbi:MAG: hypothetical protein NZ553_10510 [Caldilinea sp.]|nr:hypothetical protein [Caldilinea sp.]MDW8440893.1 hypothetical protein [Caldilineaceae bacterium]
MASEPILLLLLEPDKATRQLYARELNRRWRVIAVERPIEALRALATHPIRAAILEPGAEGEQVWQMLATLQEQKRKGAPPIIICSAVDERSRAYELGVSAYLIKPVSPHQLSSEVARWLMFADSGIASSPSK